MPASSGNKGKNKHKPDFNPLLVIHRFKKVELTEQDYKYPANYCFDDMFDRNFGIMKGMIASLWK